MFEGIDKRAFALDRALIRDLYETRRAEIEANHDFTSWRPRPLEALPIGERDDRQRLSPHGDPLMDAFNAQR